MTPAQPVLEMRHVAKHFADRGTAVEILRNVDLTVREGEFVFITGPSGSGKSTCLHLAALLDSPTSGEVLVDGEEMSRADERRLCAVRSQKIGVVFQRSCLLQYRSVLDNVMFRFRYIAAAPDLREARECALRALHVVGLGDIAHRPARLLSGGEMQRVAIARAIALEPRLLIADEPTGNLDRSAGLMVMQAFAGLNRGGLTILMVTHNEALMPFSSRRLLLKDGGVHPSLQ